MNIKIIFMFIIRMDISGNFGDIMFQYNKNIRDYNDNMRLYLDIIANRERVQAQNNYRSRNDYAYYYTQPVRPLNNIFSSLFPTIRRGNTLQDVIVRPTQEQIITATEIIAFDENISNNNTNCPITLEPFIHGERICKIKHCSHLFKRSALNDWFRRNVRCPVCRYDIRDYVEIEEVNVEDDDEFEVDGDVNNEYSEIISELLNEHAEQNQNQTQTQNQTQNQTQQQSQTQQQNQQSNTRSDLTSSLTNVLRGFINNELSNLPPRLNNVASELLYTFDIPLSFDVSGNLRV